MYKYGLHLRLEDITNLGYILTCLLIFLSSSSLKDPYEYDSASGLFKQRLGRIEYERPYGRPWKGSGKWVFRFVPAELRVSGVSSVASAVESPAVQPIWLNSLNLEQDPLTLVLKREMGYTPLEDIRLRVAAESSIELGDMGPPSETERISQYPQPRITLRILKDLFDAGLPPSV